MNINRQNYEEWLLLYVDNELSLAERIIVDDFLAANPDLQQELTMLQQSTFQPEDAIVFEHKSALYKNESSGITDASCEQFFVLYADNELSNEQKAAVEEFVYRNPQHQASFELIQQAKLTPDRSIVFPDKKLLYRSEKERRVVTMSWWKIAAAAVLILLIGGVSYKLLVQSDDKGTLAGKDNTKATEQSSGIASNDSVTDQTQDTPAIQPSQESEVPANDQQNAEGNAPKPAPAAIPKDKYGNKRNQPPGQLALPVIPSPITPADDKRYRINPSVQNNKDYAANLPEKKSGDESNTTVASSVIPKEAASLKAADQPVTGKIAAAVNNTAIDPGDMAAVSNTAWDLNSNTDEELIPAQPRKGKMRGLFRKVSRVFEKATNADTDDNRKGNIRIANFEIDLK
ncbi:hypothetical protein HHL16_02280 [Pseudoflavitalea sp. G-6-1-2]|uniref:anti-sigma factor family protein n=1 Tax=Pseudoflavitalea sp. G-6-1-2 TaxID=2728841 RepID=UPI00146DDE3F|nr:hypothetical protein [Pseudoflavitalea sp. G-6-1-2]NML19678.1 hypothetical protein [Pseudoflavitalea sp. G-6-1-2]